MKPPSSRSCSKVRYINITSPPYGREKRNLLPSVKGSNRHHFGVPPGLAPTRIIQHLIAKVNMGCACRILFLLPKITVFETENAFGNPGSHPTRKMAKQIIFLPKYTPGAWRCPRNGQANFAYTFGLFEGILDMRMPPSRLFTKAVVLLNTLSGILDVFHQIAGLAIQQLAECFDIFPRNAFAAS